MYKNRFLSMISSKIINPFLVLQPPLSGVHLVWMQTLQIVLFNTRRFQKISIRLLDARARRCTFYTLRPIDFSTNSVGKIINDELSLIESSIQEFSEGIGRSIEVDCLAQCQNWMISAKSECKLVTRLNFKLKDHSTLSTQISTQISTQKFSSTEFNVFKSTLSNLLHPIFSRERFSHYRRQEGGIKSSDIVMI
jgi:hypothetical protein